MTITNEERLATLARLHQQMCNATADRNHPLVKLVERWQKT